MEYCTQSYTLTVIVFSADAAVLIFPKKFTSVYDIPCEHLIQPVSNTVTFSPHSEIWMGAVVTRSNLLLSTVYEVKCAKGLTTPRAVLSHPRMTHKNQRWQSLCSKKREQSHHWYLLPRQQRVFFWWAWSTASWSGIRDLLANRTRQQLWWKPAHIKLH